LDSERWIEVKGKRTNKVKDSKTITASYSYPNNFKALATFTEPTPSPHTVPITDLQKLATTKKKNKHPTQKHVEHTLRLLAQQESPFLECSIIRAENETTEIAKRDTYVHPKIHVYLPTPNIQKALPLMQCALHRFSMSDTPTPTDVKPHHTIMAAVPNTPRLQQTKTSLNW
jgi:hypothetical protein